MKNILNKLFGEKWIDKSSTFFLITVISCFTSCKKFVDEQLPETRLSREIVFTDDATATSAITGIYNYMMSANESFANGSNLSLTSLSGLTSDELIDYGAWDLNSIEFGINQISTTNQYITTLWLSLYKTIYMANSAMEGLDQSAGVTENTKNQLVGEALFSRAFAYYYLVNLFGDVPLVTSTDYKTNALKPRVPIQEVFMIITQDLERSLQLMGDQYAGEGRVRPNSGAVKALLARVYLHLEEWQKAEEMSTEIIDDPNYFLLADLNQVFLRNSAEAIWQLMPVNPDFNTNEAQFFVVQWWPSYSVLNRNLVDSYDLTDKRLLNWIGSFDTGTELVYFPYKYKVVDFQAPITEFSMVMRVAEQYLIRAEARAMQGNITGDNSAETDLNAIRLRAGLLPTDVSDQTEMLNAILEEKRLELFTEWGHRWFDIKRTGKADAVLSILKGDNWSATDELYPIPQQEFINNPNLGDQNLGYN